MTTDQTPITAKAIEGGLLRFLELGNFRTVHSTSGLVLRLRAEADADGHG
jgi:hypothetical protein